jgi:DNA-directed DNA polymerase III PolC
MSASKDDFVHLHLHTDFSALDGASRVSDYVKEAAARGNAAIAVTDHGTMRGYMAQHDACEEHGIKPIYGSEFYVSLDMRRRGLTDEEKVEITKGLGKSEHRGAIKDYEERHGIRDRWHITVWAMTQDGLRNMYRLSSASFIDGFYYKPRIDLAELIKYSDGLLVSTGCLSSPINDNWILGKKRQALEFAEKLYEVFGDRLYLEIQPHAIREQRTANALMLKLKERFPGAKLVATQDAHYVNQSDSSHHEVLLCIGTGSNMSDPDRFKFDGDEFHMRDRRQMVDAFGRHHEFIPKSLVKEALNSTLEVAERVETKLVIDYHATMLPKPPMPEKYGDDAFAYLRDLCLDGWKWRGVEKRAQRYADFKGITLSEAFSLYRDRLKHELSALKRQHFVPYFLIVYDIYRHCRENSILTGPGRGSVGGSLVAYLIGITAVDPIEHGLIFERFLAPSRIDMPDVDMDFEDRRRGEVIQYLIDRYGRERVAQIATVGKLSGKQCIRDVSRVLEVPLAEVNQVTKSIIERSSGDERASQTIEDSFKDFEVCREFNKKYPAVLHHAKHLEGLSKNLGIHAAGVVTSPVPLTEIVPLEIRKHDGRDVIVTALDMHGVSALGLVKMDVLGLRTLTVLKEALEEIERAHGVKIDLEGEDFDLNDPKVLQGFTDHDYGGVFQYDTPSADKICMGVEFTSFEDVAAMTALNRPGTARSGLATKFVERKKNPKLVKKVDFHPKVSEITADTLGIIVYQEHVIRIFTEIAGFAPGTADSLRKTIAKKVGDETIGKERENFIEGALKHTPGMDEKTANKIMDAITFFGCLAEYTPVFTPNGTRRIDSLKAGDGIYSVGNDGKLITNKIKAVGPSGRKKVFRIVTSDGVSVVASEGHWWRTATGWAKTSGLKKDALVYSVRAKRKAIHESSASQWPDTGVTNRHKENLLPFRERSQRQPLRPDQDGSGALGIRAQSRDGATLGPEVGERRNRPPSGRRWDEQQLGQLVVAESFITHDAPQESLQRAALHREGVRASGVFAANVQGLLPGVVPFQAHSHGHSGWVGEGLGRVWDAANRRQEGADSHNPSQYAQDEDSTPARPAGRSNATCTGIHTVAGVEGAASAFGVFGRKLRSEGPSAWHVQGSLCSVVSVEPAGEVDTWDLECEIPGEFANYLVGDEERGWLISHNSYGFNKSHATEYGMIAYWGMYLKKYYPLEFYYSLLKNEPDRVRIQQLAKSAKATGIQLLPPHVNVSSKNFAVDRKHNAIRGSLVDIKGVGDAATDAIVGAQPFVDLADYLTRVDRRKAHKGVTLALAKAGALEGLIPSVKWFVESVESGELWKIAAKGNQERLKEFIATGAGAAEYPEEDRVLMSSSVNPLAFGRHPIDAYNDFMTKYVSVDIADMGDENFFKDYESKGCFIAGIIVEVRYNQIGDFHSGTPPSEEERRRMFWGARYANVNIEGASGKQNRTKFDIGIFDRERPLIDSGIGTPLIAHVGTNVKFENMAAHFAVSLAGLRAKLASGIETTVFEDIVMGNHPAKTYPWKDAETAKARITNERFKKSKFGGIFVGVVTHVRLKYDKNGNLMAFFGVIGADNTFIDVIAFASVWEYARKVVKDGRLLMLEVEKKPDSFRGWAHFCGHKVKWLKKSTKSSAIGEAAE